MENDYRQNIPGTTIPYIGVPFSYLGENPDLGPTPRGNDQTGIARSIAFSLADIDSEIAPKPKTPEPPRRTYSQDGFIGFRIFNLEF